MKKIDPVFTEIFPTAPKKGDVIRFNIIWASIKIIATHGFDKITFGNIGDKLNIGKAHVRYYFKSTEEILEACILYITKVAQKITIEEVQKHESGYDKLLGIANGAFKWAKDHPDHAKVMLLFYYMASTKMSSGYLILHTQIRQAGKERIKELLIESGIKKEVELKTNIIQGIITNNLLEFYSTSFSKDLEEKRNITQKQIDYVLQS